MNTSLIAQNGFLDWLVGQDPGRMGEPRLEWTNMPESWGVFVLLFALILIVFGVFWMYRREIDTCPMPIKLLMAGLRLATLLFFIALLLRPSIFYQQVTEIKPTIDLLLDGSLSFGRGDLYRDEKRAGRLAEASGLDAVSIADGSVRRSDLVNRVLADKQLIQSIRDKGTLQVVNFSDGTKKIAVLPANLVSTEASSEQSAEDRPDPEAADVSSEDGGLIQEAVPDLVPEGLGTDLWQALRESIDNANRLSAIVLISDGQHNGSEDPIEIASRAQSLGIPIYVIGVGDPNPPRNVSVNEVFVRSKAYPDEPFEVEAILQVNSSGDRGGMPGQLAVDLVQQRFNERTGQMEDRQIIQSKQVDVPEKGGRIRVDFDHTLSEPGRYTYTVQVENLDNETQTDDNALASSELEVVDEQVKVLLISGLPSFDYQHVQRLLQRDQTIALSCWLQSMDESRPQEGNLPISRLPKTIEELGQYNIVMMMDPNPQEFDAEWIETLKTFIKNKAGGVLYMAGPQFSSEFVTLNRLNGIREILPVRFGDSESIATNQALATATASRPGKMLLVNHNMDHPVLSFHADPAATQRTWSQMPGIYWSFPALTAKPTARVLMEHGDQVNAQGNQPLMVAGRYGAGTVLYMGFQGSWRWRPLGLQAQFFDRFWIQVSRFLVENRSLQGSRRGFVDSDQTEYELGQRVLLVGRVLDNQFRPSTEPTIEAIVQDADGRSQTLEMQLLPQQEGRYEGTFVAQRTGKFEATIDLGIPDSDEKLIDPISFRVVAPSAESSSFWLNEKLLKDIAETSGGEYIELDRVSELPSALPRLVTRAEFNSPPEPIWDVNQYLRFSFFLLPVLLLTCEWALRKWYKLL
ncbi:MAG: VWA domain-containing protein [Mariniblastus sp.]|nr:VWA domain-containing protein [Mariniblastus sp.]